MTQANISQFALQLGNAASPEVFATIEEVLSLSGFGKTNELIDVTNFDSGLVKEYIPWRNPQFSANQSGAFAG
jgi:hypothetical protein